MRATKFSLDDFEERIVSLEPGEKFDFTLSPADAFGDYMEEGVHKLQREVFMINDHFDHDNIYPGAVITLMDEEEHRFMARVKRVEADFVTVDTNHPLAGKTLNFTGEVIENRPATDDEINALIKHMTGGCGGCGGHCGDGGCGEGCGDGGCGEGCGGCK